MGQKISRSKALVFLEIEVGMIRDEYKETVSSVGLSSISPSGRSLICGDGMTFLDDDNSKKVNVLIGIDGFPSKLHPFVNMDLFCEMMLSVKHEEQHVKQYAEIYKQHTEEARNMALDHVSTFYNPRYYRYNYGNMLHEIDANIEGIKNTRKYFKDNFPEYNVDMALCEIMHRRQSSSPYTWMTAERRKFSSVDDLIVSMEVHKQDVSEYRPHFTYPKRDINESPDKLESYVENSSRSFRLAWDDLDGLVQRNTAAQLNLMDSLKDMSYFESVCDKDVKLRGDIAEEKFEWNVSEEEEQSSFC